MVEFIGAAAAGLQFAKFSSSAAYAVPDFARRVRKAPTTQDHWIDQATLFTSTSLEAYKNLDRNMVLSPIIDRLTKELECVRSVLHDTTMNTNDGKIARLRKKIRIVRKENELNREMLAIGQRIVFLSHLATLHHMNNTPVDDSRSSSISTNTLVAHTTQQTMPVTTRIPNHPILSTVRNLNFVGRVDLLQKLSLKMSWSKGSLTAITGLGGLGKSELATELAHTLYHESPHLSVFWLDASTDDTLTAGLREINGLAESPSSTPEALRVATIRWSSSPISATCLLIIDNVDVSSFSSSALETLLRPMCDRHVLFITRNKRLALDYAHPSDIIDMPPMSEGNARQLLLSFIGPHVSDGRCATGLVSELGGHPLAIKGAGIYIMSTGRSLSTVLALLRQDPSFLSVLLAQNIVFNNRRAIATEHHDSIYTLKSLAVFNGDVAVILFLLSCLDCSNLSDDVIKVIADTDSKEEALNILQAYSLLQPNRRTMTWKMPEVVRLTAQGQLPHRLDRVRSLVLALKLVIALEASPVTESYGVHRHYLHVASVLRSVITYAIPGEFSPGNIKLTIQLSTRLCQYLVDRGKADEAIAITTHIITWAPVVVTGLVSAYEKLRSNLGVAYHGSGRFTVAENITREVIRSQIHTMGEDHLDTLHSLNNIGVYEQEQGRFSLAERYHRKVLDMKRDRFDPHHLEIFLTLNNLGLSLQSQKNFEEAERCFVQALRGRKGRLPNTHLDVLVSMSNLGVLNQLQGRFEQARQLHMVALEGRALALGPVHPETLKSKGNLALVLQRQGQNDESADLLRGVCQAYKAGLGLSHPDTIKSLRNLAFIFHGQSKFAEAEMLIIEVLNILEEKHGKGAFETFHTLQYLATLLHWQGKLEDALEMMATLYDMQKAMLDKDHPDTMHSRAYLAELEGELVESGQDSLIIISYVL